MQTFASEAAIALERTRSAIALREALERERAARLDRAGGCARELDLDAALQAAVEETARALGATRCFVRLGERGRGAAGRRRVARIRSSRPVGDAADAAAGLQPRRPRPAHRGDRRAGGRARARPAGPRRARAMKELGSGASRRRPVLVFDQSRRRAERRTARSARNWSQGDLPLLEAVAAEIGLAIRLGRLLEENREQLGAAGRAAARGPGAERRARSRRRPPAARRPGGGAAARRRRGLLPARAGARCPPLRRRPRLRQLAARLRARRLGRGLAGRRHPRGPAAVASAYGEAYDPVPHPAYDGFTDVIAAPMRWSGDVQGVLGVGRRDGRPFGSRDADVLDAFAGLASLALRNAETYASSSRQARIQRGFYRIASVLGQSLSRSATLEAVAQAATEALGGASAAVLDRRGRAPRAAAASHELPALVRRAARQGVDERRRRARAGGVARAAIARRAARWPSDDRLPGDWRCVGRRARLRRAPLRARSRRRGRQAAASSLSSSPRSAPSPRTTSSSRAISPTPTRGALERSELFEAERSARALAQQLSAHGPPADERARSGGRARRGRPAGAGARQRRGVPRSACSRRRSRRHAPRRARARRTRSARAVRLERLALRRRLPVRLAGRAGGRRARTCGRAALDPMLAAGHRAYLGVPLAGPEGAPLGGALGLRRRARAPGARRRSRRCSRFAGSTSAALSNAELYQRVALEKERSVAILANIADGIVAVDRDGEVVLWNAAAERITGIAGRRRARPHRRPRCSTGTSSRRSGRAIGRPARPDHARPRGGLALGHRGGHARPRGCGRRPHLRLPRHLRRPARRAGQVRLRLDRLARAANAADLDLRLRRDAAAPGRHVRRGRAEDVPRLHRLGVAAADLDRRRAPQRRAARHRRPAGQLSPTDVRDVVGRVVADVEDLEDAAANGHRFVLDLPEEPLAATRRRREAAPGLLDPRSTTRSSYSPDGGTVTVGAAAQARSRSR